MEFQLYWLPEGRVIATVEAEDYHAAVRKTPTPYRKYKGEVYACNAWFAEISLWSGGWMLGGTRKYDSSPFVRKTDAINFAIQSVEVNKARPGYENAEITYEIMPCYSKNPIPAVD